MPPRSPCAHVLTHTHERIYHGIRVVAIEVPAGPAYAARCQRNLRSSRHCQFPRHRDMSIAYMSDPPDILSRLRSRRNSALRPPPWASGTSAMCFARCTSHRKSSSDVKMTCAKSTSGCLHVRFVSTAKTDPANKARNTNAALVAGRRFRTLRRGRDRRRLTGFRQVAMCVRPRLGRTAYKRPPETRLPPRPRSPLPPPLSPTSTAHPPATTRHVPLPSLFTCISAISQRVPASPNSAVGPKKHTRGCTPQPRATHCSVDRGARARAAADGCHIGRAPRRVGFTAPSARGCASSYDVVARVVREGRAGQARGCIVYVTVE